MRILQIVLLPLIFSIILAGCSSKPTKADQMRSYATELQKQVDLKNSLAKDWEKGAKLVESGENLLKEGEDKVKQAEELMEEGKDDIEKAKEEISEGKKLIEESEKAFKENFPGIDLEKK
jgi:outer membrane murein-binding lipoprotein Lpp